ncbi:hypothetical protein EMIHUDRAFT_458678 [Emiliania huxleyi CCMP1516]|uniref:SLC41A/MgtE integral membrane domain-containing protein n=2 Tax=Emiliania huxleyi TaxID=2903 RepID=A0A0D3J3X3_EMIH1|nr:hypothetical protein EMIHUDRAFT_447975 [Emiliania huxleyi CCMP1516]XP_005772196.1 hypothetical protein EMIHUDRAFT_458678 [Emiliania huxleyi CCMP1516]EOD18208.1 hypothetical protein EMIHUDRAFT_447975 [Emiliania huxleyi CCMP1516]EOD19767.1 hypothetical protein EMIHUDRAFT_458678 [Emiliania huxleyi CCMP1516]|eukprot:XP_005770637.1 hypothetical protein EMIHUDRAFT_447975 [Emiliania huxleyi CCMP1516]
MFVDGEGRLSSAPSEELEYLKKTGIDDYLFAARTGWLAFFLCGLLLCALLEREIELAFFVPLIIGHGGNSGGQAVSTVIRSIGRRSPSGSEAISTVATEALAGALQSLLLGCLVGPALHFFLDTSRAVSTVMATTLPLLGLFSNCTGAMLPFLTAAPGQLVVIRMLSRTSY